MITYQVEKLSEKKQHIDMNGVLRIGRLTGFKTLSPKHFERTLYLLLARASSVTVHSYPIEIVDIYFCGAGLCVFLCDCFTDPITELKVKVQAMRMLSINCYRDGKKGD